ncbi:MAG: hypothetical protein B7Z80_24705 [Rhodospirillales bacterium 20-64-7]|nr:MAG: hypothetical protein B7Z80_24705 [Rhodospirillales bacterium 20-64-7]
MAKILVCDIEWSPATAYVWRMFDENISPAQLIDPGGLLCFSAHWIGSKEFLFYSEWQHGKFYMAEALRDLLNEADAVVTYNGDRYDIPKIRGHLMLSGLKPFAPPTSIDLIKTIKKFGFVMNRLAYIAPLLNVGAKIKHEGFDLWRSVLEGDKAAQARMEKYCVQDVRVTAALYKKILPFIHNHPHLGEDKGECGACNSTNVHKRGYRRTKYFKVQRLQCQECGSWSDGARQKIK